MENQNMLLKTLGQHRTAIDNTLAIFSTMQQHGEDILKTTLEQSPWLPESSKNVCLFYADFYAKYLDNLKSMAELGFTEMERISMQGLRPEVNKSQQTPPPQPKTPPPAKKSPTVRAKKVNAEKSVVAQTTSAKKPGTQNAPSAKPVTENIPPEKTVIHEKPEVMKSSEIQAETSIPKPAVTSQTTADAALGNKESTSKHLPPKG